MTTHILKARRLALIVSLMLWGAAPGVRAAERELHWDALEVDARLDANGVLDVVERHTMVFTGDWNGGERLFTLRPRQKLEFISLERVDTSTGEQQQLSEARTPSNVDEFSWPNRRTLRWRSRLPSDPPFASTSLIYVLHYKLSGILQKDEALYRLDHDFAFPDRAGLIARFSLSLALDPVWRPLSEFRDRHSAGPLLPGQNFVLTIPLYYSGPDAPIANDGRRPKAIVGAVVALFGVFAFIVLGFLARERSLGRFHRVAPTSIDGAWIEKHIVGHPAELVGAVWDGRIGTPEVVALIARIVGEGKLKSEVGGADSMTLRLKVDRSTLDGHERALVDGLFFDNRTETSTKAVQEHYRSMGFDPSAAIKPYLERQVKSLMPPGKAHVGWRTGLALILVGTALLAWTEYLEPVLFGAAIVMVAASIFLSALLQIPGWLFRSRIDLGTKTLVACMIPAFLVCLGTAAFLWFVVGAGLIELPLTMIGAIMTWAIFVSYASINGMKSRQSRDAIAFRIHLAAGRTYFQKELEKARPELRDNWYPWLLAFGLGRQVDVWSTRHTSTSTDSSTWHSTGSSSSNTSTERPGWTGGGGLSGGGGASGAWAAAAAGMATGIAAPSSSSSGGGGGGGGSSSGSSSGGGGGGGW